MAIKKGLAKLMSITLMATSVWTPTFAQQSTNQEVIVNQSTADTQLMTTPGSIILNPQVYVGDGFKVEFKVSSYWGDQFQGEFIITNTGKEKLENWSLGFDFVHEIKQLWEGQVFEKQGDSYIIKNLGYNQDINPGEVVRVGFIAQYQDQIGLPENYKLLGVKQTAKDYGVAFKVTGDWGTGFNGEISITNNGDKPLEDWQLEFDYNRAIEQFWDAQMVKVSDKHYIVKNNGYNANIQPGQTIRLGFSGNPGNVNDEPTQYKLTYRGLEVDYTKDKDQDGLGDYLEDILGTNPNQEDTDQDGLKDGYEYFVLRTNPLSKDTDQDGIEDGQEDFDNDQLVNLQEYQYKGNPFEGDTDYDGLGDYSEYIKGTHLNERDTDRDGIIDTNEEALGFDALNPDTDGDGVLDGDEKCEVVRTVSGENVDPDVIPTIEMTIPAESVESLEIAKVAGDNWYIPKEMPGYIGAGYEFNLETTFDEAKLSFKLAPRLVEKANFVPAIYYVDEVNQELVELPNQAWDSKTQTISTQITHFSKYIVLNKTDFERGFVDVIKPPVEGEVMNTPLDIAFAIDSSGSMQSNDPYDIRKQTTKDFIDILRSDDRVAIVDFDQYAYIRCALTMDKEAAKRGVNGIDSYGGTSLTAGVREALRQLGVTSVYSLKTISDVSYEQSPIEKGQSNGLIFGAEHQKADVANMNAYALPTQNSDERLKYVVLLTDGEGDYSNSLTQSAIANNIAIYTVGLGQSFNASLLKSIAGATGGEFYHASSAGELIEKFKKLREEIVDLTTDTDHDGLSDYHEKHLRMFNGTYTQTDLQVKDTDGDGLWDGEEIYPVYQYINGAKSVKYYRLKSNPTVPDTDYDGINDKADPQPVSYNVTDRTLALVAGLSYSNLKPYIGKTIGELSDKGVTFANLEKEYVKELRDAKIVFSNESGIGWWGDFGSDRGLGSVGVEIKRNGKKNAVIYGLRGTEPGSDPVNDGITDAVLGLGWSSAQSDVAFSEYQAVAYSSNKDYYIVGHSLGGRLTQDVIYKIYNANEGFLGTFNKASIAEPKYSATFNGLGYNGIVYKTLENDLLAQYKNKLHNYYYDGDMVGQSLGANPFGTFKHAGTDMGAWIARDKNGVVIPISNNFYEMTKVHDIKLWHYDSDLKYPSISLRD